MISKTTLVLTLSFIFCATAFSARGVQQAPQTILLKNGKAQTCTLLSDDGSKIKVRRFVDKKIVTYSYAELHPRTIYRLMKSRTNNADARGQLKIASYALDHDLFEISRRHFRLAQKADAELGNKIEEQLRALRRRAGKRMLTWSREQLAAGKVLKAERHLGMLLEKYPFTEFAAEARVLLDNIADRAMTVRKKKTEDRAAKGAKRADERAQRRLVHGKKHYAKAHELKRKALKSTKRHSQAIRYFQQAIREFEKGSKELLKLKAEVKPNSPLDALIASYLKTVTQDTVETQLYLASEFFYRGSLKNSRDVALEARALDPKNAEVKRMLGRLEVAANSDNNFRRGRR